MLATPYPAYARLSYAGVRLPSITAMLDTPCLSWPLSRAVECRAHLPILQYHRLDWLACKKGPSLEGQEGLPIRRCALHIEAPLLACRAHMQASEMNCCPCKRTWPTSGKRSIGLLIGGSPEAVCCIRSFTAVDTPCHTRQVLSAALCKTLSDHPVLKCLEYCIATSETSELMVLRSTQDRIAMSTFAEPDFASRST